jgi:hypothetical protein
MARGPEQAHGHDVTKADDRARPATKEIEEILPDEGQTRHRWASVWKHIRAVCLLALVLGLAKMF